MSLLEYIAELPGEEYHFDLAAPYNEARENTWRLSCSDEERAQLTVAHVVGAYEQCVAALRSRFAGEGHSTPAVFYVWHDEQAGQLRSSITSLPPDKLLFGATVRQVQLEQVVEDFLNASSFIAWSELELTDEPADDDREHFVDVWHAFVA